LKASGAILSTHSLAEAERRYFRPHCLCITGKDEMPPCAEVAESTGPVAAAEVPAASMTSPGASRVPHARPAMQVERASITETVYVTKTGGKYHRAGCRYLSKSAIPIALKDAASGYSPCSVCRPPALSR
jgi:hypothetical protein